MLFRSQSRLLNALSAALLVLKQSPDPRSDETWEAAWRHLAPHLRANAPLLKGVGNCRLVQRALDQLSKDSGRIGPRLRKHWIFHRGLIALITSSAGLAAAALLFFKLFRR